MSTDLGVAAPPVVAPSPVLPPPGGGLAIVFNGDVRIPAGIVDLESFRRWARSEEQECRKGVRFAYLAGTLWVDETMEQLYTHNQVKAEVARVLGQLVKTSRSGLFIPHGMILSNAAAELSTVPDSLFVSFTALQSGLVREVAGRRTGVVELEGSPDMVLEVVSESSVEKDNTLLPPLYHRAGVQEFWRIDARGDLRFEILRRTDTEDVPTQAADGWWYSEVFARSFRMTQQADPLGHPAFVLEERP
jgi:Uma2 family endonuclease